MHAVEQVQQVPAPRARRHHRRARVCGPAVEQGADPVAIARQQQRHDGGEVAQQVTLAHAAGTETDRSAQVQQEPDADFAVFLVLTHVRCLQPRRHVPVDVPHVVAGAVFAQVGKIQPKAAEQRAVVALQQAVEAAHHGPFQAAQQGLGLPCVDAGQRRAGGHAAGCGLRAAPAPPIAQAPEHGIPMGAPGPAAPAGCG
ncbi:hypothetical protein D3C72_1497740 [compost metagenome]